MVERSATAEPELCLDHKALRWLDEHPSPGALVLAYTVTRCCGGTVRDVRLRGENGQIDSHNRCAGSPQSMVGRCWWTPESSTDCQPVYLSPFAALGG